MFRDSTTADPEFTSVLELDLASVQASIAGPKRPRTEFCWTMSRKNSSNRSRRRCDNEFRERVAVANADFAVGTGDVVIAAITSCTNTSNPSVMLAAGLLPATLLRRG